MGMKNKKEEKKECVRKKKIKRKNDDWTGGEQTSKKERNYKAENIKIRDKEITNTFMKIKKKRRKI